MQNINVEIEPEEVLSNSSEFVQLSEQYKNEVCIIYEIVDELAVSWGGQAAERYVKAIQTDKDLYVKLGLALGDAANLLYSVAKKYQDLEENL